MNSIRRERKNERKVTLILSLALYLFLFIFLFCPIVINPASAAMTSCVGTNLSISPAKFRISTTNMNGSFGYGYMSITACTSNFAGYRITMNSASADARLRYDNAAYGSYISPIAAPVEVDDVNEFAVNTWGWGLSNLVDAEHGVNAANGHGLYRPMPNANETPVTVGHTESSGPEDTVIYFGAKVNTALAYGSYSDTIVVTIVNNDVARNTSFEDAFSYYGATQTTVGGMSTYRLQDMTNDICDSVSVDAASTTLVDVRDNEVYDVVKKADGRCWINESMHLGGNSDMTLTSETTDLNTKTSWVLPASTASSGWAQSTDAKVDISNVNDPVYNWYAATAGTSLSSGNAADSICPYGWTLPSAPEDVQSGAGDGKVWTSSAKSSTDAYLVYGATFEEGKVKTMSSQAKTGSAAVYCVARTDIYSDVTPGESTDPGMSGTTTGGSGNLASRSIPAAQNPQSQQSQGGNEVEEGNAPAQGVTEETEISEEILAAVANIETMIKNLPSASDITIDYSAMIESVMKTYSALSDFERSLIDDYLNLKYEAVVAAYKNLLDNGSINGVLVAAGLSAAALATGAVVVIAAKKKREERYYGDE